MHRVKTVMGMIGLVILAIVALGLSAAALMRFSPTEPTTAEPPPPQNSPAATPTSETTGPTATNSPNPRRSPTAPTENGPTVVILGDSHSHGDPEQTWVGEVSEQLGWGTVENMSAPGRGYLAAPRECDTEPCTRFIGTVEAIAEQNPDLVIVFGGAADGDLDIGPASLEFFQELREALPEAALVGISPVSTESPTPYWLTLHTNSIEIAVSTVNGEFIDVGQPGEGDGESLSSRARDEISATIVDALE